VETFVIVQSAELEVSMVNDDGVMGYQMSLQ